MFDKERKSQFSKILEHLAESLDISESRFREAEARYQAVGKWLERDGSTVAEFNPVIYTQGSFRLGTVIKPITDNEEYDIDLVCRLDLSKDQVSQKLLKDMVGIEIKSYAQSNNMMSPVEEGKRSWTLNYSDEAQFHMDILPAIPDSDSFKLLLRTQGISGSITDHAIAITDNTLPNYPFIVEDWLRSNPKGYAEWFKNSMEIQFNAKRLIFAESIRAKAEDVPAYKVKTPLQRAIQLLKRHRDVMFEHNSDDKPISMIITTLAAHAYNNEADLSDALLSIVKGMPEHILTRNGAPWIPNPVNPDENFADKWETHPQREKNFLIWLKHVQTDLNEAFNSGNLSNMAEGLKPRFGDRIVNQAASKMPPTHNKSEIAAASITPSIRISQPSKPWRS